jgi:hypothetical protein
VGNLFTLASEFLLTFISSFMQQSFIRGSDRNPGLRGDQPSTLRYSDAVTSIQWNIARAVDIPEEPLQATSSCPDSD